MERSTGSGTAAYTTSYTYDDASGGGWLSRQASPDGVSTSYTYNTAGQRLSVTDGAGDTTTYAYDALGRQVKLTYPDATATAAGYDGDGNRLSTADALGSSSTFTYDPTGLVTAEVQPVTGSSGITTSFGYDAAGNQTRYTDGNGSQWQYTYNPWGLPEKRIEPYTAAYTTAADSTFTTGYDADQNPATLTEPGGVTVTSTYNNVGELTGQSGTGADAATPARTFGYDTDGNLTSAATSNTLGTGSNATSESFTYDDRGLVLTATGSAGSTSYGYNNAGNLTRNGAKTLAYDARDELTSDGTNSYAYTARGTASSESSPSGSIAVSFDAYGDQAAAGARAYAYDALGRLTADTPAAGGGYAFSYVGKTGTVASDGTSGYTWDPSGSTLAAVGAPGGGTGGTLAFTNAHGDLLGQFTAAGTAASGSRAYDPWGAVTATAGSVTGMLGYQSAWSDPAAGKDLMGARWYNPQAGDFTSADTVQVAPVPDPAAGNPFAYAADDPLTGMDPTGHCPSWLAWACPAVHAVASGFDVARHAVASGFDAARSLSAAMYKTNVALASLALRAVRNVAVKVVDKVKTVYHKTVRTAKTVYHKTVQTAKTVARKTAQAAAWVPKHVQRAAAATGSFVVRHAAQIGGAVTGAAAFAGCEAASVGAGSIACAAAAGAAASAVSYAISSAQSHSFSWSGLGTAAAEGGLAGAVTGGLLGAAADLAGSEAASAAAEDAASAEEEAPAAGCLFGGQSFTAGTLVLLASGKTTPISSLRPGDKVLATSTSTGKTQPETVTAVEVNHDHDLYDLTVKTSRGTGVIHTTAAHLFWDPYLDKWTPANELSKNEHLKAPNGTAVTVVGGTVPKQHDGWMWDLTVPGNNDHDFYVVTPVADVLVHNANLPCANGATPPGDTTLYRFGSGPETTEGLAQQAAKAADTPDVASGGGNFPHGISTSSRLGSKIAASGEYRSAQVQDLLEAGFDVVKTGANGAHYTVVLPNPVTDLVTEALNAVLGSAGG